jgi:hypothetical protein
MKGDLVLVGCDREPIRGGTQEVNEYSNRTCCFWFRKLLFRFDGADADATAVADDDDDDDDEDDDDDDDEDEDDVDVDDDQATASIEG